MLRLESVTKRYGSREAVHELTLEVGDGETCVLIGPSGCGKTTTLRMVNRLVEPTSGRIVIDGEDVTSVDPVQLRRRVGYVIQHVGLFPHQSVAVNVATVPRLLGWSRERTRQRVEELLTLVGLDPSTFRDRYPHELSGGQRQRVGVARALAVDPPILLLDEPFGAVDPITRERLQHEFVRLQATMHKTAVFVTHDVDEAIAVGDRIAVLKEGGVLEQYDSPARVLGQPATVFVAEFLGADRAVKRLAVTPIDRADLEPADPTGAAASSTAAGVPITATLQDALAAMLLDDRGAVPVVDDGVVIGMLTFPRLHAAARRSLNAG
jgi:osmoprotectant transport system ATP-binding protein